jgi:hypothetical protein
MTDRYQPSPTSGETPAPGWMRVVLVWFNGTQATKFELSERAKAKLVELEPSVDPSFYAEKTIAARGHPALLQVADELGDELGGEHCRFKIKQFPKSVQKTAVIRTFHLGNENIMWSADELIHRSLRRVRPAELTHKQLIDFVFRLKRLEYCVKHQPNPNDFEYSTE